MTRRKGLGKGQGKGYKNIISPDPIVHSMSARGVKQKQSLNPQIKPLKDQAEFYPFLWKQNKGIFFRGTANGKGLGFGVLGEGLYVTWTEGMANAFGRISAEQSGGTVKIEKYKLPKDLKLIDNRSKTYCDIKRGLGVNCWDNIDNPVFARILTDEVKKLGYDGVISSDKADGIVIFDPTKIEKINNPHSKKSNLFKVTEIPLKTRGRYTTVRRGEKGHHLYFPSTFKEDPYTKYSYGKSITLGRKHLIQLSKTNPEAYVHFLVSDGHSTTFVQVKNIRVIV